MHGTYLKKEDRDITGIKKMRPRNRFFIYIYIIVYIRQKQ